MSSVDGFDPAMKRAATSMHFCVDAFPHTPQQGPLLSPPQQPGGDGFSGGACCRSSMMSPEERGGCGEATDVASPPPRPPQRSESADATCCSGDEATHAHQQLLHLEHPAHYTRRLIAFDSEDATTPERETRATRGPFSSMEASDSTTTALFATTQMLNATTMPLGPPSEDSQTSASAFSPSVHRPTVVDGERESDQRGSDGRAALLGSGRRNAQENAWARNPSNGLISLLPATHGDPADPVQHQGTPRGEGIDALPSAAADLYHGEGGAESDDEDEDGLFQETVLFMNNTLHSLGSTRRTPNKSTQQPQSPQMRGGSSPIPKIPDSLEATPTKATREDACRRLDSTGAASCRPDRTDAPCAAAGHGYGALPAEMNASATTTSTQAYMTAPASPATLYSPRAPAAFATPLLAPQLPRAEPPTVTAATQAHSNHSNAQTEYLFIDNHDGTAYLADASLQLDGSYALGQTILLARSSAASPIPSNPSRRGVNGSDDGSCGAMSPVVVPQPADSLPVQRDRPAHRPVRGATLPEAATSRCTTTSPGSPIPSAFSGSFVSSVAPSVSRVLVRRSPAVERDASAGPALPPGVAAGDVHPGSCLLPASFSNSFCFDQTLLVPLEDTLRSSFAASASPCMPDRRAQAVARTSSVASVASYRSTAPARWESAASPIVVLPTSPAASFSVYPSSRSHAPSMANSMSRASPVPHAPSVARQIASQQARATRDTRPSRPEQDVIYLVPAGAATSTVTPEDITGQGWIPVQVVDVLPSARAGASSGSPVHHTRTDNNNNNNNGGGGAYVFAGGRTVSPVPKDPGASAHPLGHRIEQEEAEDGNGVREQSLSRLSYNRPDDYSAPNASFGLASNLSASTLECINRRLSYSVSGWASARQRFGASLSTADRGSVSGTAMPPATPLTLSAGGGESLPRPTPTMQAPSFTHGGSKSRPCGLSIRVGASRDSVEGAWADDYTSGSPVPLPPGTPEAPQREGSPSRCTADATPVKACDAADGQTLADGGAGSHIENSLLTSMSFQRPSATMTTMSEDGPGDYSMSLPLTSSASQSMGLGTNGGDYGTARTSNAASLNLHHPFMQHQVLRAPHPRRVSATTALSQGASLLSLQTFGEQSDQQTSSDGATIHANQPNSRSNMSVAAATSFRTTYCNNRTSPASVAATSLNPSSAGPISGVAGAGLPLSRGTLGASLGARGAVHGASHYPPHKHHYPQQFAAAAERRRGNPGGGTAHANASSLSADSLAARSGAVSRNLPQHHPYLSVQQQQFQQQQQHRVRRAGAAGRGDGAAGAPRRSGGARLVPDTSVFLPWAPLTITPDVSLNICRGGGGEQRERAADVNAACANGVGGDTRMHLIPYTSSAETSTMTTTTTTHTTTTTTTSGVREVAQQLADNWAGNESAELSPETLRTLSAAVAAMSRAACDGDGEAFLKEDGTVNKDAFVSSFLQHAASQAATSVGDGSLNGGSTMTTTTSATTTTTTTTMSGAAKSFAVSRATMSANELHAQDRSQRLDFQSMATMEATMNQFQGSVSAVSAQEPEPRVPVVVHTDAAIGGKENGRGLRGSAARTSQSMGASRPSGLREGSTANAERLPGKTRSPPSHVPVSSTEVKLTARRSV